MYLFKHSIFNILLFFLMPIFGYSQFNVLDLKSDVRLRKNFKIRSVKVTDKSTVIKFSFTNNYDGSGTVYLFPPNHKNAFYLSTVDGKCQLLDIQDIGGINQPTLIGIGQTINFSAKFQPMSKSIRKFDLVEGQIGSWSLYGIEVPNNQSSTPLNSKVLMPMSLPEFYTEGTWSGEVRNGLANGKGTFISDKLYFSGNIKNGKISGYSECHLKKKEARLAGNFINGKIVGEGILTFDNSIDMPVWYGTEEIKYTMSEFVNGLPNGKALSYKSDGTLVLIGSCENGECKYDSKPPNRYDINNILVSAGFVFGALYVSKHGVQGLSSFYSKYGVGLVSCGLQYNVGNQISNAYIAAIVTESIGVVAEQRKYSKKNIIVSSALNKISEELNKKGFTDASKSVPIYAFVECLYDNWFSK